MAPSSSVMARWGARLLAMACGGLPVLAFPAVSAWWLAFIGLAPALALSRLAPTAREAAIRGLFAGVGFFALLIHWVIPFVGPFTVVAAVLFGLLWMPIGWVARLLLRPPLGARRAALALAAVPSAWVVIEFARSWDRLAGPWGLLGATQWRARPVLALTALGGVWAVSFLLALTSTAAVVATARDAARPARALALATAAVAVAGALAYGQLRAVPEAVGAIRVAGVQPGLVPDAAELVDWQLSQTAALDEPVDLVVWGQRSIAWDVTADPELEHRLREASAAAGAPLLVQTDIRDGDQHVRSALLIGPDGQLDRYDKMRLVPFGEYVPLRPLLGWVDQVTDAAVEDIRRGQQIAVLDIDGAAVGPLISYESKFPDLRRRLAIAGAEAAVLQGSMAGYHGTWAQPQQASVEALRAVESGRAGLQAGLNGISAAFDADGQLLEWIPADVRGVYVVDLPLRHGRTPYVRWGDWVPALSALVLAVAAAGSLARRLSGRGSAAGASAGRR